MLPERNTTAKLVVCEDDRATLDLLCDHLTADRFEVHAAPTAADALRLCQFSSPDLLLLDLGLPDASGLDVLREIREPDRSLSRFDPGIGVIVLSGRGTERDRVRGLEQGADDYLVKPFGFGELLARIRSVLLRRADQPDDLVRVSGIVINRAERSVKVDERLVELSGKEYSLLRSLATQPTRVFTKEELLQDVWGYRSLGHTRTLEAHASRLRRKLDPETGQYIINCWGVGYRLIAP